MPVELVKLDEATVKFLADYQRLVDGNNALDLGSIAALEPVVVSHEQDVIDLSSRRAELTDNIHTAARQLKAHYDQLADSDQLFIPYWTQETTFLQTVSDFPEIERRKLFRSYMGWLEKNQFSERLSIDQRLEYFRAFYSASTIPQSEKEALKAIKKRTTYSLLMPKFTLPAVVPVFLTAGYELNRFGNSPDVSSVSSQIVSYLSYAAALIAPVFTSFVENSSNVTGFEEIIHKPMQKKAKYADGLIERIQKYG